MIFSDNPCGKYSTKERKEQLFDYGLSVYQK